MRRGEIWWGDLPEPVGSGPGYPRPVLIVQSDPFNRSRLKTVIVAAITSNTGWASSPGNVFIPASASGLPMDSVINVSQVLTIDRSLLTEYVGDLSPAWMAKVDDGLRLALGLRVELPSLGEAPNQGYK